MGDRQSAFLLDFAVAFHRHFGTDFSWNGGQAFDNTAGLLTHKAGRRAVGVRKAERFELGDLTTVFRGHKIIVEFESKQVPISNLLKYWPYLRGELSTKPSNPVLLCHFSDWWSYAVNRDLWEWTISRMQADSGCLVGVTGCQFDHGGKDLSLRCSSIEAALLWLKAQLPQAAPGAPERAA